MDKVKKKKDKKLHTQLVDPITGDYVDNAVTTKTSDDYVEIHYDEYFIMSTEAFKYINTVLSRSDIGVVVELANKVKTPFNLVFKDNNKPFNLDELQSHFKFSGSSFRRLFNKLCKLNIISYYEGYKLIPVKGNSSNKVRAKVKWVILNPFIARKRKIVNKDLINIFDTAEDLLLYHNQTLNSNE